MPRQLDQLPADTTSLARRIKALEQQVTELRAARRLSSATAELIRTAASGARVEINGTTQAIDVYGDDGTTLLAELATNTSGIAGAGLWTRGLQDPVNLAAFLGGGELDFRTVETDLVSVSAGILYDTDGATFADLDLTSGALGGADKQAKIILETLAGGANGSVYVTGDGSNLCNLDVDGVLTTGNLAWGSVTLTPTTVNTPISATVNGLNVRGSTFIGFASAVTSLPGSTTTNNGVTGVSTNNVSSTGLTVWLTRQSLTATTVNWLVIGI